MLQQTQVATVIPYYRRFLNRFPNVQALATADESEVLRLWEGLGYYRRARQMHLAARIVVERFGGALPTDADVLASLPGLGRYSANAVLTFSANRRLPILEANTRRLWQRLAGVRTAASTGPMERELWLLAESALPQNNAGAFNQALMDLGATVCTPHQPRCPSCPVREWCIAHQSGQPELFAVKAARTKTVSKEHVAVIVTAGDKVLVKQRDREEVWGGLWEFPRVERLPGESLEEAVQRALRVHKAGPCRIAGAIATLRHAVMHYRIQLHGFHAAACGKSAQTRRSVGVWMPMVELEKLPLSSPQRRLARAFFLNYVNSKRI